MTLPRKQGVPKASPAATPSPRPSQTVHRDPFSTPIAREDKRAEVKVEEPGEALDPLDPAMRQAAQLTPPTAFAGSQPQTMESQVGPVEVLPRARVSMEELLPQLVRRIAWAGDRRKGTVQLELGAGRHVGTTVTVHADGGRVRVEVEGADIEELRARIDARLRRHGIDVESVS